MNYRKPFTQTDNIKAISSIPNFKTLQNITYKSWPVQKKERYHWAINGIKHTTQKNCTGKLQIGLFFCQLKNLRNDAKLSIWWRLSQ